LRSSPGAVAERSDEQIARAVLAHFLLRSSPGAVAERSPGRLPAHPDYLLDVAILARRGGRAQPASGSRRR